MSGEKMNCKPTSSTTTANDAVAGKCNGFTAYIGM